MSNLLSQLFRDVEKTLFDTAVFLLAPSLTANIKAVHELTCHGLA